MASTKIRTYSGLMVDVFNLHIDNIKIVDICIGLSNIPRFAGQGEFYSVAKHCIEVCNMLPKEHKLAGLLHDASEAYIGDMPTPIKNCLPGYLSLEKLIMSKVCEKFKIDIYHPAVIDADHASFLQESKILWTDSSFREDTKETRADFLNLFYANL